MIRFRCVPPFTGRRCERKGEEDIDVLEVIGESVQYSNTIQQRFV